MPKPLNWGLISTGGIAETFAKAIPQSPDARLWSVVSRKQKTAGAFAKKHQVPHSFSSIEKFAADPELDVAVVCTPHPMHMDNALACLNAGVHVLCEKPMALNQVQVSRMIAAAQANKRFLMEAMWMYFIPATIKARELVLDGAIGTPRIVTADFGHPVRRDPKNRFFDLALGGGTLLDMGIYPLSIAYAFFGRPDRITGHAQMGKTGVDEQIAMTLDYDDGRMANLTATMLAKTGCEAVVAGRKGNIRLHQNFWQSEKLSIKDLSGAETVIEVPVKVSGYKYEIDHVNARIRAGEMESDRVPWQMSLDLAWMMDSLRAQWGLRYPDEG